MGQAVAQIVEHRVHRRRRTLLRTRGASIGLTATATDRVVRQIEAGFPFKSLESLSALSGLSTTEIASILRIPERTLARRNAAGRLRPDESERLLRISTIFEKAVELFEGDIGAAANWLRAPKRALGGQSPLTYSGTELGAREVERLIGRLEHGVFS